jgi:hypothetical protein
MPPRWDHRKLASTSWYTEKDKPGTDDISLGALLVIADSAKSTNAAVLRIEKMIAASLREGDDVRLGAQLSEMLTKQSAGGSVAWWGSIPQRDRGLLVGRATGRKLRASDARQLARLGHVPGWRVDGMKFVRKGPQR